MRLLPVLLIALALLPISTGIWCHTEEVADGIVIKERRKGHCNETVTFCLILDVPKVNTTVRGCESPGTCAATGCAPLMMQGLSGSQCCCNEDFCNDDVIAEIRSATFAPARADDAVEGDWDFNVAVDNSTSSSSAACPTIFISFAAVAMIAARI